MGYPHPARRRRPSRAFVSFSAWPVDSSSNRRSSRDVVDRDPGVPEVVVIRKVARREGVIGHEELGHAPADRCPLGARRKSSPALFEHGELRTPVLDQPAKTGMDRGSLSPGTRDAPTFMSPPSRRPGYPRAGTKSAPCRGRHRTPAPSCTAAASSTRTCSGGTSANSNRSSLGTVSHVRPDDIARFPRFERAALGLRAPPRESEWASPGALMVVQP